MRRDHQGKYVTISTVGEKSQAFVPAPLPPSPPIGWTPDLRSQSDEALLPDTSLFLYMYLRKEVVIYDMLWNGGMLVRGSTHPQVRTMSNAAY